jgi:dTDP-3-amino-3,4,6-trideoxy-alpha-D-glucose transaminase
MVPFVALERAGTARSGAFIGSVEKIVQRGRYLLGEETDAFEFEFAEWCGADHAIALSSGAAALQLALMSVGVSAGDEVIVPAFTAVPTASAVTALGAVPVPVDVLPNTAALDPALVAASTTSRTRAVIVVHLYGLQAQLPSTDLLIVEDAAQAHGAVRNHHRSAAVAYSFYPTKNLGGIGDGGAVVTNDSARAAQIRRLRVHGMTEMYVHEDISQNFRISEVEASWLRLGLPSLRAGNARRRAIAARYRAAAPHLRWQAESDDHVYHLCVARVPNRDEFRAQLASAGVATAVHYPLAITQQPAYRHFTRAAAPEAEAWARECVSLPCFPELTDDEVDQVCGALAAWTSGSSS